MALDGDPFGTLARVEATRAATTNRPIYATPKATRITVNCKTGERTIESVDYQPPPAPRLIGRAKPESQQALDAAVRAISATWEVPPLVLLRRTTIPSSAKFAVYLMLRRQGGMAMKEIGRVTDRDHSTIVAGLKKAKDHYTKNEAWQRKYDAAGALYWNLLAERHAHGAPQ